MKKVFLGLLALGFISATANAACNSGACFGKVEKIYMTASGTMYVKIEGDASNLNCTAPGGVYMSLKEGDTGKNAMYALLLSAKASNKKVAVRVVEGSSDCRVAYVKTID